MLLLYILIINYCSLLTAWLSLLRMGGFYFALIWYCDASFKTKYDTAKYVENITRPKEMF